MKRQDCEIYFLSSHTILLQASMMLFKRIYLSLASQGTFFTNKTNDVTSEKAL